MSTIILYTNTAPREKLNKSDDITAIETLTGNWRDSVDILTPVIQIEPSGSATLTKIITDCNYIYITEFGRYYYVTGKKAIAQNIVELSCEVDACMSWKSAILAQNVIVARNEKQWSAYLDDAALKIYNNPNITTYEFPTGFSTQEFVMAIAGS